MATYKEKSNKDLIKTLNEKRLRLNGGSIGALPKFFARRINNGESHFNRRWFATEAGKFNPGNKIGEIVLQLGCVGEGIIYPKPVALSDKE